MRERGESETEYKKTYPKRPFVLSSFEFKGLRQETVLSTGGS